MRLAAAAPFRPCWRRLRAERGTRLPGPSAELTCRSVELPGPCVGLAGEDETGPPRRPSTRVRGATRRARNSPAGLQDSPAGVRGPSARVGTRARERGTRQPQRGTCARERGTRQPQRGTRGRMRLAAAAPFRPCWRRLRAERGTRLPGPSAELTCRSVELPGPCVGLAGAAEAGPLPRPSTRVGGAARRARNSPAGLQDSPAGVRGPSARVGTRARERGTRQPERGTRGRMRLAAAAPFRPCWRRLRAERGTRLPGPSAELTCRSVELPGPCVGLAGAG